MPFIELHDHINPNQIVPVNSEGIIAIVPFGSGSSLQMSTGSPIGVHETPEEVMALIKSA